MKVGVVGEVIVTFNVAVEAHCPALGVNVYVVVPAVLVLIVEGLQVPLMEFVEVSGKDGATAFWHKGPIAANAGVTCGVTVTFKVVVVAHCPALGVNVYVVVPAALVLIVDGLQVPLMEFVEVSGKDGAAEF